VPDDSDTLELYVHSPAFDKECAVYSKGIGQDSPADSTSSYSSDLWEKDDSSVPSVESSPYVVSKIEAHLYYFGIRGPRCWGPKLIFRTSKDVFTVPSGPEQDPRCMQLRPVYEHHKLSKDDLWATIRSKVCNFLEAQLCKLTFAPRSLNSLTSETFCFRLLTLFVLAGLRRMRETR